MRIESRVLPDQLPDLGDLPPLLTRLYAARGVRSARELDRSLRALLPWNLLKGRRATCGINARKRCCN